MNNKHRIDVVVVCEYMSECGSVGVCVG
jgi:hypothetical protein